MEGGLSIWGMGKASLFVRVFAEGKMMNELCDAKSVRGLPMGCCQSSLGRVGFWGFPEGRKREVSACMIKLLIM